MVAQSSALTGWLKPHFPSLTQVMWLRCLKDVYHVLLKI
jgi:hypothetical protein